MSLRFLSMFLMLGLSHAASAQCISVPACPAATDTMSVCALNNNNPELWFEQVFFNPITNSHDLFETETALTATAVNTPNCPGPTSVAFELYLDLDGNDTVETVLLSSSLPAAGRIRFGNISDPVNGGILTTFDSRPVPANEKYRFAAQTTVNSSEVTATLKFTKDATPGVYTMPYLPNGRHYIKWIFSDPGGSTATCIRHFNITDCKKPTVVCLNGVAVNLMPTSPPIITVYDSDFLQYGEDNVTTGNYLVYGIRKSGTGTGFPVNHSLTFDCNELGVNIVEVWALDQYGNADYCETTLNLTDAFGYCPNSANAQVSFCVRNWCDGALVSGVDTAYVMNNQDPRLVITDPTTCSALYSMPNSGSLSVSMVKKDDMLNGVTIFDIIKIARHILGIEPFTSPYQMLAADLNQSGSVTTFDIVNIATLLTGGTLPGIRDSWTILDSVSQTRTWTAPNPVSTHLNVPFIAIKTGDLSCDALPNFKSKVTEDRDIKPLHINDFTIQAGQTVEVPISFTTAEHWLGYQMSLRYDPDLLSVVSYSTSFNTSGSSYINTDIPGQINLVWYNAQPVYTPSGFEFITVKFTANATVQLKNALSLAPVGEPLPPYGYDVFSEEHIFTLDFTSGSNSPETSFTIQHPAPNPVGDAGTTIKISLQKSQSATVSLFDITGKQCFMQTASLSQGENNLVIPAEAFGSGSGVYAWKVTTVDGSAGGKVVKM